jgi:hypothetical protein
MDPRGTNIAEAGGEEDNAETQSALRSKIKIAGGRWMTEARSKDGTKDTEFAAENMDRGLEMATSRPTSVSARRIAGGI